MKTAALLLVALFAWPLTGSVQAVEVETPGPYRRVVLNMPQALGDRADLIVYLGLQDQAVRQAWVRVPTHGRCLAPIVDASALQVTDSSLAGILQVHVRIPGEERVWMGVYRIDARLVDGHASGNFTGDYAQRNRPVIDNEELHVQPSDVRWTRQGGPLEGEVQGHLQPLARQQGQVAISLRSACSLPGAPAVFLGRVAFDMTMENGAVTTASVKPTNKKALGHWQPGTATATARIVIEGDSLTGSTVFSITSKGGTRAGDYVMAFEGDLTGNHFSGRSTLRRKGSDAVVASDSIVGTLRRTDDGVVYSMDDGVLDLSLAGGNAGSKAIALQIDRRDGQVHVAKTIGNLPVLGDLDLSQVVFGDGTLTGPLVVNLVPGSGYVFDEPMAVTYVVDLACGTDGVATGTYRTEAFGERPMTKGALSGRVIGQDDLRQDFALPTGHDWPTWFGPNQNMTPEPFSSELVKDLQQARLLWKSEHLPPARMQVDRYGEKNVRRLLERGGPAGGGCSPLVYDGRVYVYYSSPVDAGEYDEQVIKKLAQKKHRTWKALWSKHCDDIIVAMDAATGQTLWKTTFKGDGIYMQHPLFNSSSKRGAFTTSMCGGSGKVLVHRSAMKTVCLDAATGRLVWEVTEGNGEVGTVVEDRYVTAHGGSLVALDMATGDKVWSVPGVGSRIVCPVVWRHGERSYVVSGNESGRLACVDVVSGEPLWIQEHVGLQAKMSLSLAAADLLLLDAQMERKEEGILACYRLTERGAEKQWAIDDPTYRFSGCKTMPTVDDGIVYFRIVDKTVPRRIVAIDLATGKDISAGPGGVMSYGSGGPVMYAGGRLIVQIDSSHSKTPLDLFSVDGPHIERLGSWSPPHAQTSAYWPIIMVNPIVDGRIFIRGQRGIWCYDLRAGQN